MDAVIALSPPLREIPMSGHSAVGTVLVVAKLRAMALRTQCHDFGEGYALAIREPKGGVSLGRIMAGRTRQFSVFAQYVLVKMSEWDAQTGEFICGLRGMTRFTSESDAATSIVNDIDRYYGVIPGQNRYVMEQ